MSAVTYSDANGIQKVFEDGEKLFRLAGKIGVAAFGLGGLEGRSIGSFVHEFEIAHPELINAPITEVAEKLRRFFLEVYVRVGERSFGIPFEEIPAEKKGLLGLIVGGYYPGGFLSEAWEIRIPTNAEPGSAKQICTPGSFMVAWFAICTPIERYLFGYDRALLSDTSAFIEEILGPPGRPRNLTSPTPGATFPSSAERSRQW